MNQNPPQILSGPYGTELKRLNLEGTADDLAQVAGAYAAAGAGVIAAPFFGLRTKIEQGVSPRVIAEYMKEVARAINQVLKSDRAGDQPQSIGAISLGPAGDCYTDAKNICPGHIRDLTAEQFAALGAAELLGEKATILFETNPASRYVIAAAQAASKFGLERDKAIYLLTANNEGRLPSGETIADAIMAIRAQAGKIGQVQLGLNCFAPSLLPGLVANGLMRELSAIFPNASSASHADLEGSTLHHGVSCSSTFAQQLYGAAQHLNPNTTNYVTGCCGTTPGDVAVFTNTFAYPAQAFMNTSTTMAFA